MKKIGKFNLIKENICNEACNCGWNMTIGGLCEKDRLLIKKFLRSFKKE